MTTLEVLIAARKLIERPEHWRQGGGSLDGAPPYCALNALSVAIGQSEPLANSAYTCLAKLTGRYRVADFNDNHSHEQVLNLFDRAIAEQQRELTERLDAEEKQADAEGLPKYKPLSEGDLGLLALETLIKKSDEWAPNPKAKERA